MIISVASGIPFDSTVTEAIIHAIPIIEYAKNGVSKSIETLW